MARLPSKNDLSSPGSFRSGRGYASANTSAAAQGLSQFGQGLQQASTALLQVQEEERRRSLVETVPPIDAEAKTYLNDFARSLDEDPDPSTVGRRYDAWVEKNTAQFAKGIPDAKAQAAWSNDFKAYAISKREQVLNSADRRIKDAKVTGLTTALDQYRNIYIDPKVSDAEREKARADIQATIATAEQTGVILPSTAQQWRQTAIDGAELSFAELWLKQNKTKLTEGFASRLATRESGGRPGVINSLGYVGKYQFGAPRLADLGVYDPKGENLGGWSRRKGTQGKWTGEFNIPGHPEVKTLQDFRNSPEAQDAVYEIHRQRMDQEIAREGLEGFVGQTVAGVKVTREGIYAMMHLGGAKGAARALKSGGASNATDAYGTSVLDYLKLGAGGEDIKPPNYDRLDPIQRAAVDQATESVIREGRVALRAQLEGTVSDVPAAIQVSGRYDGPMPTPSQFMAAYGPEEGAERYREFQAETETSRAVYDMRTMSAADIQRIVGESVPTSSGEDAAMELKRYEAISTAASAILKARDADPVGYARQSFPEVDAAWQGVNNGRVPMHEAVRLTVAAQEGMGVPADKIQAVPQSVVQGAVATFNNPQASEEVRVGALTGPLFMTADPDQQRAIYQSMVEAGAPEYVEGALRAMQRGDTASARRLFRAALVEPDKLPGKLPNTDAEIREYIQDTLMSSGEIGDVFYGLSGGIADNYIRAQNDTTLLTRAAQLRMVQGEPMGSAVDNAARDLFGDVQAVTGTEDVRTYILLPAGDNPRRVLMGLRSLKPRVGEALRAAVAPSIDMANEQDGTRAVVSAATENHFANVLEEGFFVQTGDGYAFMDPYTASVVPDKDGKPLIFSPQDVLAAGNASMGDDVGASLSEVERRMMNLPDEMKPMADPWAPMLPPQ